MHTLTAGPDNPAQITELTSGGAHVTVDALGAAETAIPAQASRFPDMLRMVETGKLGSRKSMHRASGSHRFRAAPDSLW